MDEGLFIDFDDHLTPELQRRLTQLIFYAAEHGADAIGLACSVYAPVVKIVSSLVNVPLISSYGALMAAAVQTGNRIGIIASVPATLRDSEFYLRQTALEHGVPVEPRLCFAEDLIPVLRAEGQAGFRRRLGEEVVKLAPDVDAVLLSQFSMASTLEYVRGLTSVPVLSAPHCSASRLKELLTAAS